MQHANRLWLLAACGLAASALSCNVQPSGSGKAPEVTWVTTPEAARPQTQPLTPTPLSEPGVTPRKAARPLGPTATKPAPLPQADQRIAIWHSGNVEGELAPCG